MEGNTTKLGADFTKSEPNSAKMEDKKNEATKEIAEIEAMVSELKEHLVRALAENENLKKRQQKELETATKFANSSILKDLTEPFEQLFMALSIKPSQEIAQSAEFISLMSGIEMTKKTFEKAFEKHGLKRIFPQGEKFDHNHHQAISQVKQEGVDAGIVINVVQAGYVLEERVLKPAMVVVSS
jgi:molecular chaperone GrpE